MVALPYFWVKVAFGIATGLLIPSWIVGLLACAAGNAALFMYTRAGANSAGLPLDGIAQLHVEHFRVRRRGLVGGRPGLRRIFYKIRRAAR